MLMYLQEWKGEGGLGTTKAKGTKALPGGPARHLSGSRGRSQGGLLLRELQLL